MKQIRQICTWYRILLKRLLKKPSFLVILALIPLLALAMTSISDEKGGFLHIAVAAEDPTDSYAQTVIDRICAESELVAYEICATPEEARAAVSNGSADTAWILEEDLAEKIETVAGGKMIKLAHVVVGEDTTFVRTARERLFGALYADISYELYLRYVDELTLPEELLTEEALRSNYEIFSKDRQIVEFTYLDAEVAAAKNTNYLTSPLRGLLAVLMLMCGLAGTMYFLTNEREKTFACLPPFKRVCVFFANNLAAVSLAAVFVTVALVFSDNYTSFGQETLLMALYVLMATGFCTFIGALCRHLNGLALCLPVVLVLAVALSPVFFNIKAFESLQALLPPYHYLYGVADLSRVPAMALYIAVSFVGAGSFYWLAHRNGEQ
ncbi:MAG: ABC transporter permease [Ruminococcaceae bacterium]|nr:ABC transporter permease [Oscillospiraceae bacterium]